MAGLEPTRSWMEQLLLRQPCLPIPTTPAKCPRRESNSQQAFAQRILSPLCIPVPPLGRKSCLCSFQDYHVGNHSWQSRAYNWSGNIENLCGPAGLGTWRGGSSESHIHRRDGVRRRSIPNTAPERCQTCSSGCFSSRGLAGDVSPDGCGAPSCLARS